MGRVGVDLYPEQIGVPLAKVRTFAKSLGGSATNVAVAAARLGHRSAVITKVGDDGFGPYVREALEGFGVDARWVGTDPTLRTPIVFCEIYPPDHFPLLFYRQPKAPDMNLTGDELDLAAIREAPLFWTTGTGLSEEPSRSATLAAMNARVVEGGGRRGAGFIPAAGRGESPHQTAGGRRGAGFIPAAGRGESPHQTAITVHDLDYRPMLWSDAGEARRWAVEAVRRSTVVVGNLDEVEMATGTRDPEAAARALQDLGAELAIVKRGPAGVYARRRDEVAEVPPVQVEVVCGVGAGDAFGGGLCHGLLLGWPLERTMLFANAAGAYVASQLACADAMPSEDQVEALLERV
jgi:5-dehydro-2-deoxygluconokinase